MRETLTLQTQEFRFSFHVESRARDEEYVNLQAIFELEPLFGELKLQSPTSSIAIKDLQSLIAYFEKHIRRIHKEPSHESLVFISGEMDFQIQALAGEIEMPDAGMFGIRCTVCVMEQGEGANYVWLGGQGHIYLKQCHAFINALKTFLTSFTGLAF